MYPEQGVLADKVVARTNRRTKVVLVAQSLLVATCLAVMLYLHLNQQQLASRDDAHIQFDVIADITANDTLRFENVRSSHQMHLTDERHSKIAVRCAGPYVLYADVCYHSFRSGANGMLRLRVVGRATPLFAFQLERQPMACEALHAVVYLRAGDKAELDLRSVGRFKIKNVTVGLGYLLGGRCEF